MGITKTAAGIFAGSVAVDVFKAEKNADSTMKKIVLKAAGSVAAATSIHLLTEEVVDVVEKRIEKRGMIVKE